ncbi:MAG: hypothetical protein GX868_06720, partial [Actinobacteria bacterium]|nr:hypothetical protein [Actinomycetota bacterium]
MSIHPHDESSAAPADTTAPADATVPADTTAPETAPPEATAPEADRFADTTHLADSVRRLIRAQRSTTVPPDDVERARTLIAEAADILGASQMSGPYWQAGITSVDDFVMRDSFQDLFPWSPAFGKANPIAPKVEFSFDGTTLH